VAEGRLIAIEGIDGAGKSTLAAALHRELAARGVAVELVREPGGVELSERLRTLVADPALHVEPRAEALIYLAARAQLVAEALLPWLGEGTVLVLDRFSDSTLAYQGGGRGLGVEEMRELDAFATSGLTPDRTLLLALAPELAAQRLGGHPPERLEAEPASFFAAVARTYEELAMAEPERFTVLDAAQPAGEVLSAALDAIEDLL
jgi:dTMP kinase